MAAAIHDVIFDFHPASGNTASFADRLNFLVIDATATATGNGAFGFSDAQAFAAVGHIRATQPKSTVTLLGMGATETTGAKMQVVLMKLAAAGSTGSGFVADLLRFAFVRSQKSKPLYCGRCKGASSSRRFSSSGATGIA